MSVDWETEPYVRLYTRNTLHWRRAPWQAKAVLPLLLRAMDRDGRLEYDDGDEGVAFLLEIPIEVVTEALKHWLSVGTLMIEGPILRMPNFQIAQWARRDSSAERMRRLRERKKVTPKTSDVTTSPVTSPRHKRDDLTLSLTHSPTHPEDPKNLPSVGEKGPAAPAPIDTKSEPKPSRAKPATRCPPTDATPPELLTWCARWKIPGPEQHPEMQKFLDHARAKGCSYQDWGAAWRNWLKSPYQANGIGRMIPAVQTLPPGQKRMWK